MKFLYLLQLIKVNVFSKIVIIILVVMIMAIARVYSVHVMNADE